MIQGDVAVDGTRDAVPTSSGRWSAPFPAWFCMLLSKRFVVESPNRVRCPVDGLARKPWRGNLAPGKLLWIAWIVGSASYCPIARAQQSTAQQSTAHQSTAQPAGSLDWSRPQKPRMLGDLIVMTFRGEVFLPDGSPASEITVQAAASKLLEVKVQGNRFEFEVEKLPRGFDLGTQITVSTADGILMASRVIYDYAARAEATRVIKIRLEQTRPVDIKVTFDDKPVVGANVRVNGSFARNLVGQTNDDGVYTVRMPVNASISSLGAWTADHRIGGYQFDRGPVRNPQAAVHTIELSRCRKQRIRVLDESGNPVAQLPVKVTVATPEHYNFIPREGTEQFVTDANGEAVDSWFPDWTECNYFVNLIDDETWFKTATEEMNDGVIVVRIGKAKTLQRQRITGKIVLPRNLQGGFRVRLGSFQHPQQGRYDPVFARCDLSGQFSADVMPGATYCICVDDAQWVSDFWTGVLYDPETKQVNSPTLRLAKGERIEVEVTQGKDRAPRPNTTVSLSSRHDFNWIEDGQQKEGSLGRQWWVITDDNGQAITRAVAGDLEAHIYLPDWKPDVRTTVEPRSTKVIKFHRQTPAKRTVAGRITLPEGVDANLAGATVQLFAMDRATVDRADTKLDAEGRFGVELAGDHVGVFVKTLDGKAAGSVVAKQPDQIIELELLPTRRYRGRLLNREEQPLAGAWVRLTAHLVDEDDDHELPPTFVARMFGVDEQVVDTDNEGFFEFSGVPQDIKLRIEVKSGVQGNNLNGKRPRGKLMGTRTLRPGTDQPLDVIRTRTIN